MSKERYQARWANEQEKAAHKQYNGVVEDMGGTYGPSFVCFASPMEMAKRIAAGLNLIEHLDVDGGAKIIAAFGGSK